LQAAIRQDCGRSFESFVIGPNNCCGAAAVPAFAAVIARFPANPCLDSALIPILFIVPGRSRAFFSNEPAKRALNIHNRLIYNKLRKTAGKNKKFNHV
jgi:hypothetical protein